MKLNIDIAKAPDFSNFAAILEARGEEFYRKSLEWIVKDIIEGIVARRGIDGGPFPRLEQSTILRKLHDRPLVDKGLLSDEFTYAQTNEWKRGYGEVTIRPLTAPRAAARKTKSGRWTTRAAPGAERDTPRNEVGYALQVEGLENGKHFYFFGISRDAEEKIMAYIEVLVEDALAEVAKQ